MNEEALNGSIRKFLKTVGVNSQLRSAARYTALFQSLDRNRDGTVTRVEAKGDLSFGPVFDDMDINRDGGVTTAELQRYIEQRYGTHATR